MEGQYVNSAYIIRIRGGGMVAEWLRSPILSPSRDHPLCSWVRYWVLSIMPKISEISVTIQMERFISVSSDRNIRDHLWRWSTYFGRNIPTEIHRSIYDKPVLCPNFGNSVKEFKITIAISIGWPDLIGKCGSIFLRCSHRSLAGQFCIMESTHCTLTMPFPFSEM